MSGALPNTARREGRLLETVRRARVPSARRLARRQRAIGLTKLVMPAMALALLASLALWPEFQHISSRAEQAAKSFAAIHGDTVMDARYHSIDQQGRPFTITAEVARKLNADVIDLTKPRGDITLHGGTWLMLEGKAGTYRQRENSLDLTGGVTLYRDDGTTVQTQATTVDMKAGAAAGTEPVHATGPFGRLDAKGGFTAAGNGQQIFFAGPATLFLSGAQAQ